MSLLETVDELYEPIQKLDVQWGIHKFLSIKGVPGDYCRSPCFRFLNYIWSFRCYPFGEVDKSKDCISIFLIKDEKGPPITLHLSFDMKRKDGQEVNKTTGIATFEEKGCGHGNSYYMKRSEFLKLKHDILVSDRLVLMFTLEANCSQFIELDCRMFSQSEAAAKIPEETVAEEKVEKKELANTGEKDEQVPNKKAVDTLCQNFKDLYMSGKECDVKIRVKDETFGAHRAILGARSPVLAAMFSHNMAEKNSGVICVDDCEPEAFRILLPFVYSGMVENLSNGNVLGVYYAAEKYDLPDLKEESSLYMKTNLSVDSVCDVINLAARHGEKELLAMATDCFAENMKEILISVQWQSFMQENPTQANELYIKTFDKLMGKK